MRRLVTARLVSPRRVRALVVAGATASIVTAANASQGAYFSQSWGWVALAFLMPTTILVLLGRTTVPASLAFEPDLVLGDAYAGLGDRRGALRAYRDAVATDGRNWVAWLRLAQVARGPERARAYERVHELNPREGALPGEDASAPG